MRYLRKFLIRKRRIVAVSILFFGLIFLTVSCKQVKQSVQQSEVLKDSRWVSLTGKKCTPAPYRIVRLEPSSIKGLKVKFQIQGFEWKIIKEKKEVYQEINIPGAGEMINVGNPNLPMIRQLVAVPPGKDVKASVIFKDQRKFDKYHIFPVQEAMSEQGQFQTKFSINRDLYKLDKFPIEETDRSSFSEPMIMRGQKVVQVKIVPMEYNPAKNILIAYKEIELKIRFVDKSKKTSAALTQKQDKRAIPISYWKLYKEFLNFDWLKDHLVLRDSNYLIITPQKFAEAIGPLKKWKETKGLNTEVFEFSDCYCYSDKKLRDRVIKKYYYNSKNPPDYVLLVGDEELIPTHFYNDHYSSDLYYAAIDGDDFLPDLAVGRFSAKTEDELIGMVAKTIAYEQGNPVSPDDWYSHISLISDEDYCEETSNWVYKFMTERGYKADRFYLSKCTATASNITKAVKDGRLILNYRGHGDFHGWTTGEFGNPEVLKLENYHKLPVVISLSCNTGYFDAPPPGFFNDPDPDCFGEAWLKAGGKKGEYGAVAFWGSSRGSDSGYNDELCKGVYKAAFYDRLNAFGDITNKAKLYMYKFYGDSLECKSHFYLYNVLGDPEINILFKLPTASEDGWKTTDLDILGAMHVGGITKKVIRDLESQNAFPMLVFPYHNSPECLTTFSVPADWDYLTDFLIECIWYSPNQNGSIKWSIVYDRKNVSKTPIVGFNRKVKYFRGIKKDQVAYSAIELYSLTKNGAINPGDIITLSIKRIAFENTEEDVKDAITDNVHLIAARVLYKPK